MWEIMCNKFGIIFNFMKDVYNDIEVKFGKLFFFIYIWLNVLSRVSIYFFVIM